VRARRDALHSALAAQQGGQLRALVQASLDAYVAFFEGQAVAAPAALPALLAARAWDRPAAFTVELVAEGGAAVLRPPAAVAAAAAAGAIDAAVAAAAGLPRPSGALAAAAGRGPGGRELNPSKPSEASTPPPPLAAMPAADPAVGAAKAAVSAAVLAGSAAPAALAARFAAFLPLLALAGGKGAPDAAAAARPTPEPTAAPDMEDAAAQVGALLAALGMARPGGIRHACGSDPGGAWMTWHSRLTVAGCGSPCPPHKPARMHALQAPAPQRCIAGARWRTSGARRPRSARPARTRCAPASSWCVRRRSSARWRPPQRPLRARCWAGCARARARSTTAYARPSRPWPRSSRRRGACGPGHAATRASAPHRPTRQGLRAVCGRSAGSRTTVSTSGQIC